MTTSIHLSCNNLYQYIKKGTTMTFIIPSLATQYRFNKYNAMTTFILVSFFKKTNITTTFQRFSK